MKPNQSKHKPYLISKDFHAFLILFDSKIMNHYVFKIKFIQNLQC